MKKPALLIIFLISTIIVLSLARTYISNNVATSGVVLGQIQKETESLKLENSVLAEKVYDLSSLTNLAQKAYDQGYTEGKSSFAIGTTIPVAIKQ